MKILVMGSGGVGGYFGGRLAAAGNDVTFVARGAHLASIQKDGLTLDSQLGNVTIKPAKVTQDPASAGVPEIVMFATKMTDAEGAASQLKPIVQDGVTTISFQNGVEALDILKRALPGAHAVPGVARISSHISRPGVIEHKSPFARIEFGEEKGGTSPRLEALLTACKAAGIDAIISDNIQRNVWLKFGMLATFSGITALTGHTAGKVRSTPGTRALIEDSVRETIAVGQAAGGFLGPADFAALMKTIDSNPPGMTTSMAHDRMAGKPLEVNYLSGAVVRIGERYGVAAPTHKFFAQALAIDADGRTAPIT